MYSQLSPDQRRQLNELLSMTTIRSDGTIDGQPSAPLSALMNPPAPQAPQEPRNFIRNESTGEMTSLDNAVGNQPKVLREWVTPKGTTKRLVQGVGLDGFGRQTAQMYEEEVIPDYLNPAKIAQQKAEDSGLERKLKMAELAQKIGLDPAQMFGGRPQTAQDTTAQEAAALGVPVAPQAVYSGMSQKGREDLRKREYIQAEKRLAEEEQAARAQGNLATDAQRFKELNQRTESGPIVGAAPVAWLRGLASDDVQEMKSIQDRLTPKMREPGSGATSDFDAKMFQSALFGINKNKGANDAIANAMMLKAKTEKERVSFANAYLQANGTLRGADTAWAKYAEDNPIFDPTSKDMPRLNSNRVEWRDYFRGGQPSGGQAAGGNAPAVGTTKNGYRFKGGNPASQESWEKL